MFQEHAEGVILENPEFPDTERKERMKKSVENESGYLKKDFHGVSGESDSSTGGVKILGVPSGGLWQAFSGTYLLPDL